MHIRAIQINQPLAIINKTGSCGGCVYVCVVIPSEVAAELLFSVTFLSGHFAVKNIFYISTLLL